MNVKNTVAPATEPVTLQEAKDFARVDGLDDDAMIASLIATARDEAEAITRRALVSQTWTLKLDGFPGHEHHFANDDGGHGSWRERAIIWRERTAADLAIVLPFPPLQSVTSITYVDAAGATQTMPAGDYVVDTGEPGRVTLAYGKSWPTARSVANAVTVTFVCGYGAAAAVPAAAKTFIKMRVASLYTDRVADAEKFTQILSPLKWGSYA